MSTPARRPEQPDAARLAQGRARRYGWAVFAGIGARAATPLLSIFITPYALGKLGPERFGLFALALTAAGWFALLDPGLAPGLRVVLARRSEQLDGRALAPLLGAAAWGQRALAALTLTAGAVSVLVLPWLLPAPAELLGEARELFLLVAFGAAVTTLARHHAAALDACQWSSVERAVRVGQSALRAVLLAALLACGLGLAAAGWSYLAACAAGALGLRFASRRLLPEMRGTGAPTNGALAELIRPGVWMSLGALGGVLIAGVDRAVAAGAISLEAVTVFSLTGATFLLGEAMLTSAVDAARPALGQALGGARRGEAARIYLRLVQGVSFAGPVLALALLAANRAFVGAWAGAESYGGGRLDCWFALALVVNLWSLPHRALLSADLRAREATLWRLAEGALNLGLSVALTLRFGLAGVAAGTALAAVCTSGWALPRLAARAADIPARRLVQSAAEGLAVAVVLAPLAWALRNATENVGFVGAALAAATVAGAGALIGWRLALPEATRRAWAALLRERRRAWSAAV